MQLVKTLAAASIILISTASCRKERVTAPDSVPVTEKRIVKETNTTNGEFSKYSYDAQGKVIKKESATHSWSIEYLPSMIKVTRKRIAGDVLLGTEEYTTDASGRMTNSVSKKPDGTVEGTSVYEYDAAGYMIRMKETSSFGVTYEDSLFNSTGNPFRIKSYWDGNLQDVTDFYYNEDVKNKGLGTMLVDSYGIKGFAGKLRERECSEMKRYNPSGVLVTHRINTFTTDPQKNITKYKSSYPMAGISFDYDITYE